MSLHVLLPQASDVPFWHHHGGEHGSGVSTSALQLSPLTPPTFLTTHPTQPAPDLLQGARALPVDKPRGHPQPSLEDGGGGGWITWCQNHIKATSLQELIGNQWLSLSLEMTEMQLTPNDSVFPSSSAASSAHNGKQRVYVCPSRWGRRAKLSINENKCDELENKSASRIFSPLLWLDSKKTVRSYLSSLWTILWLFTFKNCHNSQLLAHRQLSDSTLYWQLANVWGAPLKHVRFILH